MPIINHEPEYVYIEGHGRCEVLVVPKLSPSVQRRAYKKDSMTHPAKMDTMLCRELIRQYTKENELILDPMCGISTTQLEAALLGRVAIGVELEERFVKISEENIRRLGKLAPKGRAEVIKGDARELSKILKGKADVAVFSPPYAESAQDSNKSPAITKPPRPQDVRQYPRKPPINRYSENEENIGNLPYKPIDAVVFSPPFAQTPGGLTGKKNITAQLLEGRQTSASRTTFAQTMISKDKKNIDNLATTRYGEVDAIVTSPPFGEAQRGGGIAQKGYDGPKHGPTDLVGKRSYMPENVGGSRDNISNMPYGEVDAIVTSPPYSEQKKGKADPEKMAERWEKHRKKDWNSWGKSAHTPGRLRGFESMGSGYSENKDNIGNLPHGQVDAVITSPPFEKTLARENPDRRKGYWKGSGGYQSGRGTEGYGETEGNIGALPHGKIDAVITSPPYSGSDLRGKNAEARRMRLIEAGHDPKEFLGGVARNAVLKHYNEVDAVITSPPYSESMTKRRKGYTTHPQLSKTRHMGADSSDENIGNLPHGQVDAIVTSPPYEGSMESGRHTGGINERENLREGGGNLSLSVHYSKSKKNIGNKRGETYLSAMLKVYRECFGVLRPGGRMVLVLKNFIRNKEVQRLDLDTKRLCEACGFRWVETKLFRLPQMSFWRILQKKKYGDQINDWRLITFEFVEVFEKSLEVCA